MVCNTKRCDKQITLLAYPTCYLHQLVGLTSQQCHIVPIIWHIYVYFGGESLEMLSHFIFVMIYDGQSANSNIFLQNSAKLTSLGTNWFGPLPWEVYDINVGYLSRLWWRVEVRLMYSQVRYLAASGPPGGIHVDWMKDLLAIRAQTARKTRKKVNHNYIIYI
jgi:hypothetical protein